MSYDLKIECKSTLVFKMNLNFALGFSLSYAAALLKRVKCSKAVLQYLYFSVTCKAGEEFFRLPNGEIADSATTERYMDEQLAIRNFYIWSRDSYALAWYFRFEVLEELMVRKMFFSSKRKYESFIKYWGSKIFMQVLFHKEIFIYISEEFPFRETCVVSLN